MSRVVHSTVLVTPSYVAVLNFRAPPSLLNRPSNAFLARVEDKDETETETRTGGVRTAQF